MDEPPLQHVGFAEEFKWATGLPSNNRACDVYLSWVVMRITGKARVKRVFVVNRGFCMFLTPTRGEMESVLRLKDVALVAMRELKPVDQTDKTPCTHEVCVTPGGVSDPPFLFRIRQGDRRNRPLSSDPATFKRIFRLAAAAFNSHPAFTDSDGPNPLVSQAHLAKIAAAPNARTFISKWQQETRSMQSGDARAAAETADSHAPQRATDTDLGPAAAMPSRNAPAPAKSQVHSPTEVSIAVPPSQMQRPPQAVPLPAAFAADPGAARPAAGAHGLFPTSHVILPEGFTPQPRPHYPPYGVGVALPAANQAIVISVEVLPS